MILYFGNTNKKYQVAKQTGFSGISGKLGDRVYVQSRKGTIIRKAPKRVIRKDEAAFREQYIRTIFLNGLAGGLNTVLRTAYAHLRKADFYNRAQKLFRKESLDSRCLLLMQLKGMDLHPTYPLDRMGQTKLNMALVNEKFEIRLTNLTHPRPLGGTDCYFDELALITWNASNDIPAIQIQQSGWVNTSGDKYFFDFIFPVAGAQHWMLCQRQSLGISGIEKDVLATMGAQIIDVGTFDPAEQEFLNNTIEEKKAKELRERLAYRMPEEGVRVEGKKVTINALSKPRS